MEENEKKELGYTQKEEEVTAIQQVIEDIVKSKTEGVDQVLHKIRSWLKDDTTELTDLEIDDILLQLPIFIYDAIEEQEIVGMQMDLANQILKEAQSQAYKLARGTIKDKEAVADIRTRMQQKEKIIFERSYKIIKQKFELAIETLNAVKKVQASRQQRREFDSRFNRF